MPDGIDLKRIIDLDPETTVTDDDYTIVDSTTGGAKKFAIGQALGEIKDGLSDMGDRVTALEEGGTGSGLTEDIKLALLQIASKLAYIDEDGQDYYDALEEALYPPANLVSISAVYTQSGTVYDTDTLDSLKADLVVTATYSDQTTETVTDYVLSGTLTEGTSTITVTYGGKTDTFTVVVSARTVNLLYSWDFTDSLVDSVEGKTATTTATQGSTGLVFSAMNKYLELTGVFNRNRTYEIDVLSIDKTTSEYGRIFMVHDNSGTANGGSGYILTGTRKSGDIFYVNRAWESSAIVSNTQDPDGSYYNNSTLGFYVDDDGYVSVYKDGTLLGTSSTAFPTTLNGQNVYMGNGGGSGDYLFNSTFTGFRIYEGAKY